MTPSSQTRPRGFSRKSFPREAITAALENSSTDRPHAVGLGGVWMPGRGPLRPCVRPCRALGRCWASGLSGESVWRCSSHVSSGLDRAPQARLLQRVSLGRGSVPLSSWSQGIGYLPFSHTLTHARTHARTHSLAGLSGSPAPSPGPAVCLAFPGPPLPKRGMLATRWPPARSDSPRHLPVAATRLNIT